MNEACIAQAVAILRQGGLVAFPTETVYGLGANAEDPSALKHLYAVKGRPEKHPVIIHLAGAESIGQWACDIPDLAYQLAEAFWPGPMTLILKRAARVPDAVTGGQDTVGLRIPNHPVALRLLKAFGGGLAAPSANRFGRLSPTCAAHVQADLAGDVDMILDGGPCSVGIESTIIAFRDGRPVILRPGQITAAQVMALAESGSISAGSPNTVSVAPGSLSSHYAPFTPTAILEPDYLISSLPLLLAQGKRIAVLAISSCPDELRNSPGLSWKQLGETPEPYARALYAGLRELDALSPERILVEVPPQGPEWQAVSDRLRRAACLEGRLEKQKR